MATITHQRKALTYSDIYTHLAGTAVVSTVNISNLAHTQYSLSTTAPMSSGFLIKTQAYSYDGVTFTDSYISDI